jgi:hypothetical protein
VKQFVFQYLVIILSRFIDQSVPVQKIHAFMRAKTRTLLTQIYQSGFDMLPEDVKTDLLNIIQIAKNLGMLEEEIRMVENVKLTTVPLNSHRSDIHIKSVDTEYLIIKGIFKRDSAKFVHHWLDQDDQEQLNKNIERIIRHIEIKRADCMQKFDTTLSPNELLFEKMNMAIVLALYAEKYRDLRVLNTVFKLNDWLFRENNKVRNRSVLARYLHCLYRQEHAARELFTT